MFHVDKGNDQQGGEEEKIIDKGKGSSETLEQGEAQECHAQLNHRILCGYGRFATPASPPQHHIAEQGDVFIPA